MGNSTSETQATADAVKSPEEHGANTKEQSPPGLSPASAPQDSDGRKQKATVEQHEMPSNATKPSKRSSSSKASLSKASSRAGLVASKSSKTYPAQKRSSAATLTGAASLFPTIDPSPEGYPNQDTPAKLAKDIPRGKSRAQSRESPKDSTAGNVSVKPTRQGADKPAGKTGDGAGKRRGPSTGPTPVEGSRVSGASSKRASPAKKEGKGSPAAADKRSLRSKASSTRKRCPSASSKTSGHSRGKHGERCDDLEAEPDASGASVIPLAGSSRGSAGSSKRSLRALEGGSVEEKERHRKHDKRLLVMPDGTRVGLAEKNRWIRAMQKEHLTCGYKNCCFSLVFVIVMIVLVYIMTFRQDLLLELATILKDFMNAPEPPEQKESDGTPTDSSPQEGTSSPHGTPAARLRGRNHLNSAAKQEHETPP